MIEASGFPAMFHRVLMTPTGLPRMEKETKKEIEAEGERERCSERSGPGPTHNADTPTTRQLLQDKQTETCTLIHSEGTWGTYGFHGTLQILQEAVVMSRVQ